jgi:hypothetical protein
MAKPRRFQVALYQPEGAGACSLARIPFDVEAAFGRRPAVVKGTINGFPFRTTVLAYGEEYRLVVDAEMREGARAVPGDTVEVELEQDDAPRAIELPAAT